MHLIQLSPASTGLVKVIPQAPIQKETVPFQWSTFQNNGTNSMRVGDVTTSSTKGILLQAGGALTFGPALSYGQDLNEWYVYITSGDKCDIMYQE
jgi:hypothetical protein